MSQITPAAPAASSRFSMPRDPARILSSLHARLSQAGLRLGTERNAALGGRAESVLVAAEGADLDPAARLVERSLEPAPSAQIAQWLAGLRAITAHRAGSDAEARLATAIYVERLRAWPADIVAHALLRHRWRWWPALGEIEDLCEELTAPRQRLLRQLRGGWGLRRTVAEERDGPQPRDVTARRRVVAEVLGDRWAQSAPPSAPLGDVARNTWKRASLAANTMVDTDA